MSRNLDFLFDDAADEVSKAGEDISRFDRTSMRQPPTGWNASKSKSEFQAG
eukprot:CAMPEP_0197870306 /NCGR_PEP_ID=MMETSP1439-20131203/1071_1 /TAXON_ID=66791 /ORGANISM="Gonyaulax spinifera, Strain CCMP409" /LENGTH=50 /DNA_ID=CAMNT_0043489199 /DNA_START=70 /DNA_END=219 /DNA_ORIENTATION=+